MSKADKRERQKENRERAREERERLEKRDKRMRTVRSLLIVLVPVMAILVIVSLTSSDDDKDTASSTPTEAAVCKNAESEAKPDPVRSFSEPPAMTIDAAATYTATICTSEGDITLALDPKTAPIATNNFVFLAEGGFYDGLSFHRAAENFVIQGGDPNGDGSGGSGYTVTGEVPTDNYPIGALAAAKGANDPAGTFASQFFIVTGKKGATLPNDYARFGAVTKGIDVAQKIESFAPETGDGTPTQDVKIERIVIQQSGEAATSSTTTGATSSTSAP